MQITTIPLVASGQRRKASKEKNIDETQSSCQNSALLQDLFTDTHKFTIFYLLYNELSATHFYFYFLRKRVREKH